jgi:hypothetical protein
VVADEIAQRDDEFAGLDAPALHEIARGTFGQAYLLLRAEQDKVGERRFNGVADAAGTIRAGIGFSGRLVRRRHPLRQGRSLCGRVGQLAAVQVAQMRRVDREISGEGPAEHLVGRDQCLQPFVDLPVHPLATLLHPDHHRKPDADADEREKRDPDERREDAGSGTEVEAAHGVTPQPQVVTPGPAWPASLLAKPSGAIRFSAGSDVRHSRAGQAPGRNSTASTVGRCRAISSQILPGSRLAKTAPLLVPK